MIQDTKRFDMTAQGFAPAEIHAMFFAREPEIGSIIEAAMELSPRGRRLALALMMTIATNEAIEDARRAEDEARSPARAA